MDWRSPICSVRNRQSPELRRSRRMRMLGDRVVYTPPRGARRLGSRHSRRSVDWRSPISSVRNRRSPELRRSRRMRMLGDRVVYTPPQGARRRVSQ